MRRQRTALMIHPGFGVVPRDRTPTRRTHGRARFDLRSARGTMLVVTLIAAGLVSCGPFAGGDGSNFVAPNSGGAGCDPLPPLFSCLEAEIFGKICTQCHTGSSPPAGLSMDPGVAFQNLVGVPSVEQPTLNRIEPFNPDDSYVVRKLEGDPSITGGQMPLGGPFLPQATIDVIRQWITDGATDDTVSTSRQPPTVRSSFDSWNPVYAASGWSGAAWEAFFGSWAMLQALEGESVGRQREVLEVDSGPAWNLLLKVGWASVLSRGSTRGEPLPQVRFGVVGAAAAKRLWKDVVPRVQWLARHSQHWGDTVSDRFVTLRALSRAAGVLAERSHDDPSLRPAYLEVLAAARSLAFGLPQALHLSEFSSAVAAWLAFAAASPRDRDWAEDNARTAAQRAADRRVSGVVESAWRLAAVAQGAGVLGDSSLIGVTRSGHEALVGEVLAAMDGSRGASLLTIGEVAAVLQAWNVVRLSGVTIVSENGGPEPALAWILESWIARPHAALVHAGILSAAPPPPASWRSALADASINWSYIPLTGPVVRVPLSIRRMQRGRIQGDWLASPRAPAVRSARLACELLWMREDREGALPGRAEVQTWGARANRQGRDAPGDR